MVKQVLQFWFVVLHKISCQVQVRFEVLSMRGENWTEPNFATFFDHLTDNINYNNMFTVSCCIEGAEKSGKKN